jgi:hypothetical protein
MYVREVGSTQPTTGATAFLVVCSFRRTDASVLAASVEPPASFNALLEEE